MHIKRQFSPPQGSVRHGGGGCADAALHVSLLPRFSFPDVGTGVPQPSLPPRKLPVRHTWAACECVCVRRARWREEF